HAQPGAEFLPHPLLFVLRVHDLAGLDCEILRVCHDLRRDLLEEIVACRLPRAERRGCLRWAGRAAAGAGRSAKLAFADLDGNVCWQQAEDFRGDDCGHSALRGAEVLRRGLGRDGSITADDDGTLVGAGRETAPGMNRHPDSVPGRTSLALARR